MELAIMAFFLVSAGIFCLACTFVVLALVWDAVRRD